MIPSLSTGVVGSRFVSSADVETAKARRDEQWKAAYARSVHFFLSHISFSHLMSGLAKNPHHSPLRTRTMEEVWPK